jgi:hypothetical protein
MRKLILAAGVAALAISIPAAAKPDKGGGGGDRQAQVERGGKAKAQRGGGGQRVERRGGGERQAQRIERRGGGERRAVRVERRGGGERQAQRLERRGGGERRAMRIERRGGDRQAQRIERRGGERRAANVQRDRNERRAQRVERRGGNERRFANFQRDRDERRAQRIEHRGNRDVARAENRGRGNRDFARIENRGRDNRAFVRVENRGRDRQRFELRDRDGRDFARVEFRGDRDRRVERIAFDRGKFRDRDFIRIRGDDVLRVRGFGDNRILWRDRDDFRRIAEWRDWDDRDWDVHFVNRGIPAAYVGCPLGLVMDAWTCVPPLYARTLFIGQPLPAVYASSYLPIGLRSIYYDTPDYFYRWGDGYAYRVNRSNNLIAALLPLIGAGLGIGTPFPYSGASYYVPSYYQSFYPDYGYGGDYYRYANGYVYEIDGRTGLIEDIDPLLDRGFGLGQILPAGYSYYNVPYQYRDLYYDTPDYYYRYAPGAIYQVDRDSALITAVASLLTGGLSVGQPLPAAYSVYNVPLGYRDTYYDRPDAWYRYSDGYIYQVDPTTQLITAIVRSIV